MKKSRLLIAFLAILYFSSSQAAVVVFTDRIAWQSFITGPISVEDFDTLSVGILSPNTTHSLGLVDFFFAGQNVIDTPAIGVQSVGGFTDQIFIGNVFIDSVGGGTSVPGPHIFEMPTLINAFGADYFGIDAADLQIDIAGEQFTLKTSLGSAAGFFGVISSSPFSIVTMSAGEDGPNNEYFTMNNLSFSDTAIVPLPPAVWLFGSGLMGLIGIARRKTPS